MAAHEVQNRRSLPEEHAGVPEEVAGLQESLRSLYVRLLPETRDRRRLNCPGRHSFGKFDVSVPCFCPTRLNTQNHNIACLRCLERCFDEFPEPRFLCD